MKRSAVRTRLARSLGMHGTALDDETLALLNDSIEDAHQQLAIDAPDAFFVDEDWRFSTMADVSSTSSVATDRLRVNASDSRLLQRDAADPAGATPWVLDGSWDGAWLYVQDPDGRWHWHQSREWWTDQALQRVSLRHHWPNSVDAAMAYRLTQPEYPIPGDVIQIRSARIRELDVDLEVISRGERERNWMEGTAEAAYSGQPYQMHWGRHAYMEPPRLAPTVASNETAWLVPDPPGTFAYYYTWAWGRQNEVHRTRLGFREPKWESPPSPVSASITTVGGAAGAIRVDVPDGDHVHGFGLNTLPTYRRSGIFARIWCQRSAQTGTPVTEAPTIPYLLGEVNGTEATPWRFLHTGQHLDNYEVLQHTHGHRSLRLFPHPTERWEVDCRVVRRPPPLLHDEDAAKIGEEWERAHICLARWFVLDGALPDAAGAARALGEYQDWLGKFGKTATMDRARLRKRIPGMRLGDDGKLPWYGRPWTSGSGAGTP